jgi:hypothetical protein
MLTATDTGYHRPCGAGFAEVFRGAEFAADLGYQLGVAQVNCSGSRLSGALPNYGDSAALRA